MDYCALKLVLLVPSATAADEIAQREIIVEHSLGLLVRALGATTAEDIRIYVWTCYCRIERAFNW